MGIDRIEPRFCHIHNKFNKVPVIESINCIRDAFSNLWTRAAIYRRLRAKYPIFHSILSLNHIYMIIHLYIHKFFNKLNPSVFDPFKLMTEL